MTEFNRLEFNISFDHSLLGPQVVTEASWFDAEGNECSDYSTSAADNPSDGLSIALAWLEENCGVKSITSHALDGALEALRQIGGAA